MSYHRLFAFFILAFIVISLLIPLQVDSQESESVHIVKNSNGETVLTIKMKDGMITIEAQDKAAEPGITIRWESMGLHLTRIPITTRDYTKGYNGPGPVRDAANQGMAILNFDQAVEKTSIKQGNVVHTRIKFSADQVKAALKDDFSNLVKGTSIYLHGIFRSINYNEKNGVVTKTTRKNKLINWKDIMNAEPWTKGTLEGFAKYYNMEIRFMPDLQENSLYYVTLEGELIAPKTKLASKYVNEEVRWNNEPSSIDYYDSKYKLIGYYTTRKLDKTKSWIEEGFLSKGVSLDKIRSGSTKVFLGGMEVYLVYEKEKKEDPSNPEDVPKADSLKEVMEAPILGGLIRADLKSSERFDVNQGIPTTESLYTQVHSSPYLIGYHFEKRRGTEVYPVKIKKEYILSWMGQDERGEVSLRESRIVEQIVPVKRAYGYWEIINFDLYSIDEAKVYNYALPNQLCLLKPNQQYIDPPLVEIEHSLLKKDHIIIPEEIMNGITLKSQIIYGGRTKPSIPEENFSQIAKEKVPDLKVKNDSLIINGSVILDNKPTILEGPNINTSNLERIKIEGKEVKEREILYKSDQIIDSGKENGTYHSSGTIYYKRTHSLYSKYNSKIEYGILNINSVVIHTPIVCNLIYSSDNDKYVQLLEPSSDLHLVLDKEKDLNDFSLQISNYGFHSLKKGYNERDYSYSIRDPSSSYLAKNNGILRNEVKFPFDIYHYDKYGQRKLITSNTWIIMGKEEHQFSLPLWVKEGNYTASCRSIAVNGDEGKLDQISETQANTKIFNYVATNTFNIEVSGRIYGLTIYDVTDYPLWENVFRVPHSLNFKGNQSEVYPNGTHDLEYKHNFSYDYKAGINDQYGKKTNRLPKYTFPLVGGSHPQFNNQGILKAGYGIRFKLTTIGNMYSQNCNILITPRFYYLDKDGDHRQEVDLYYEDTILGENKKLVQVGNSLDQINIKFGQVASPYIGIPKRELINTAYLTEKDYQTLAAKRDGIFHYGKIQIPSSFRTFPDKESQFIQNWYGSYYLPAILYVAPKDYPVYDYGRKYGITFYEDFWFQEGHIIVNFDINTVDSKGNKRLSYTNEENHWEKGYNNMWIMEGGENKKSYKGPEFKFLPGDFLVYQIDRSIHQDYRPDGIN